MPDRQLSLANSEAAYARARKVIPGGVNSPLRAFKCMDTSPVFVKEGEGPFIVDLDGNRYIDLSMCHGGLIHGHANEQIVAALSKAIGRGTGLGFSTEIETQLATRIIEAYMPRDGSPSPIELVRLTSSSTEASMSAIRLARAATGREKIVKIAGGYHGHVDCLLCEAGGSVLALGNSSTLGVPAAHLNDTLLAPFNDLDSLETIFTKHPGQIAAVIVEPFAVNMGLILPRPDYLSKLRALCDRQNSLLIFDETETSFRVCWGGVQTLTGVHADLTLLGRVLGSGIPFGAVGGSREVMQLLSPEGAVQQSDPLAGNPLAVFAAMATLDQLEVEGVYSALDRIGHQFADGLVEAASQANVPITIHRTGSMLSLFFTSENAQPIFDLESAKKSNTKRFATFFARMLASGVLLPPSPFEPIFLSTVHTEEHIEKIIAAAGDSMRELD